MPEKFAFVSVIASIKSPNYGLDGASYHWRFFLVKLIPKRLRNLDEFI